MNTDLVIFPAHTENIRFTWRTRYFFISHGIKIKDGNSFPLDELRRFYKNNNPEGALLYTELYLYGFSFHSEVNFGFFPKDCDPDGPVIISAEKSAFPLGKIKDKKLRKLFRDLEVMVYSDVNGMYYERLRSFLGAKNVSEMLRDIGYAITAWSKLDMESFGACFLYWPEGREGLAIPNFFVPFFADLIGADERLIRFYQRVGIKKYEDFFFLNFGRVEYMARLIAKQGMPVYEAGLHQVALWSFVYRLEEAKRALNEVGLDLRFLFLPLPKGLYPEQEEVLRKYSLISLPFGHSLDLAKAYADGYLPKEIGPIEGVLREYGIHDLTPWTIFVLKKKIDSYTLSGTSFRYASDPSLMMEVVISSLRNGIVAPKGVVSSTGERSDRINGFFSKNEPEKALSSLFGERRYLPIEEVKKIPGLIAYLLSGISAYRLDEDTGLCGSKEAISSLSMKKKELFFFPTMVPFEEILDFYESNSASPLLYLEEKAVGLEYDPFPRLLLPKKKKERQERGIPEYAGEQI